jgi:tetratricopeptide (TPR) repeat protein/TolB-like protein
MQQYDRLPDDDRLMSLVDSALAQPADQREDYLRRLCGGDSELFEQARDYVEWEQRMDGFLLKPFCSLDLFDPTLEPGELLEGRFRIVRQVGEGGMATVYEAKDEKLGKRIAIKCAKAGFRARLTPEVRHATEIAHDNVCRIFEIHTAATDRGEIDFITMEFLDGPTLAAELRTGPVPEREARVIARQICAGLAAAHRGQVVHGDLKSNNIILTTAPDGSMRAVITDFGLARGLQPENAPLGGSGGVVGGARDYMAPELRNGEKPSVASDIYALGCICYEMLSGSRLREPGAPGEEARARKLPRVHPKWDRILARCLDPDPARRYRTVEEIEAALAPRSWRLMLAVAAGVVLAAAVGEGTYLKMATPPETVRLAVLPFETDAANRALSDGLVNETAERLRRVRNSRTRRLTVIPLDAVLQNKLDRPEQAVTLLAASHVLHGTLRQDGDRTMIHAYLTDAHSVLLKDLQAPYYQKDLRDLPVALTGLITGTLHLQPLAASTSVNSTAYADFTKGSALLGRDATDQAIPLLENAAKADPDSPLIYARLAEAQMVKYSLTNDSMWIEQAIVSLGNARQRNPDAVEVWLVSAMIDEYRGLYESAEADLHRALEIEPQNGDAWRRLGKIYQEKKRFADAQSAYQEAIRMQPSYFKNYQDLCALLSEEANYDVAIRHCTNMVALAPDLSESYYARANSYYDWGHYPEAEIDLRTALRLDPNSSKAIRLLASSLAYQGNYSEAISLFRRAIEIGPPTHSLYLGLGQTLRWAGLPEKAKEAYRKGVATAEDYLARNSRDRSAQAYLAYMWARLDERSKAESAAVLALDPPPAPSEALRWVVMTYEAMGEHDRALDTAEAAPDDVLRHLKRSPDLADLRNNPRFRRLMQSRRIQ